MPARWVLVLSALMALAAGWSGPLLWWRQRSVPPSWLSGELDTSLIIGGLDQAPTFGETWRWWVGPWAGQVPFYRPHTSWLFWFERQAFGNAEWLYLFPAVLLHVAATAAFSATAVELARHWRLPFPGWAGLLAGWGFSDWHWPDSGRGAELVWGHWKNQPDSAAALLGCLAVLTYCRAVAAGAHRPTSSLVFYAGACLFKESAVPLLLLAPILEWRTRRPEALTRLAWAGSVVVALQVWRLACLGGIGFTYGSNRSAVPRTLAHLLGPFSIVPAGLWLPAVAAGVVFAALICGRRWGVARVTPAAALALALAGVLDIGLRARTGSLGAGAAWDWILAGICRPLEPAVLAAAAPMLAWLLAAASLRRRPAALVFCLAWSAVAIAPLVFSPGPLHRYYLSQGGEILLYALGLTARLGPIGPGVPGPTPNEEPE